MKGSCASVFITPTPLRYLREKALNESLVRHGSVDGNTWKPSPAEKVPRHEADEESEGEFC